jgi:hypothetical protein
MNYSTYSLSELKALATANNAIPTGDKRSKKAWIDALELALQSTVELTDSEMECAAVAADIANDSTDIWADATDTTPANPLSLKGASLGETPRPLGGSPDHQHFSLPGGAIESLDDIGVGQAPTATKKGAATVFGSLLMILILTVQAILCVGCVIVQAAIHLKNLFGSYNPDYDLFGQLHDMVRDRKASPAQQAQQPAYQ